MVFTNIFFYYLIERSIYVYTQITQHIMVIKNDKWIMELHHVAFMNKQGEP